MLIFLFCFIFVALGSSLALAIPQPPKSPYAIKAEIERVETYISQLEAKLAGAKTPARRKDLNRLIDITNRRLKKLQEELNSSPPGPSPVEKKPLLPPKETPSKPLENREPLRTIGISGGMIAGVPAVIGEIRIKRPFELRAITLKIDLGYASGKDANSIQRQHFPLIINGIYHLTPPGTPGVNSYLGLGLNLDLWTTDGTTSKMGSMGADIFFGLERNAGAGKMFLEAGYDLLKTGFSPDHQGLGFSVGYRHPW